MKPHFLLINDDGIDSPGIYYLWDALKDNADITIVAPDKQRSGSGASMTLDRLTIQQVPWKGGTKAYKVSGTPVDCVKVGLSILLTSPPTMILSGVNHGTNAGQTVLFSGTVGAVIEGTLRNIPGIAFSYWKYDTADFSHITKYIWPLVEDLLKNPFPIGSFYNVNFPPHEQDEIKGLKMAPQGLSNWKEKPEKKELEDQHLHYFMHGEWHDHVEPEGTDVFYLKQGYITVAPIHVAQLTDFPLLRAQKESLENSFSQKFGL